MKIGLIGYGKMGKEIENLILETSHEITVIYTSEKLFLADMSPNCDVLIDFSFPTEVESHIKHAVLCKKNIVIGTTGWYDKIHSISSMINNSIGCVYSGNFSPGVHVMRKVTKELSLLLSSIGQYDISIIEEHHRHKIDFPSGTSLQLAAEVLSSFPEKTTITHNPQDAVLDPHSLLIAGIRNGDIIGKHTILADSSIDTITLIHSAKNRRGFAQGAILAAEKIANKKGFYEFSELI